MYLNRRRPFAAIGWVIHGCVRQRPEVQDTLQVVIGFKRGDQRPVNLFRLPILIGDFFQEDRCRECAKVGIDWVLWRLGLDWRLSVVLFPGDVGVEFNLCRGSRDTRRGQRTR